MTDAPFKDCLQEYIEIKGISLKKLSDASGIPQRYLEALLEGNYQTLPPAPYVRGYISKLADILDFDKEEMWRTYKRDAQINTNELQDRLPGNRYVIKKVNIKLITALLIAFLLIVYLGWRINKLIGLPELKITYPQADSLIVNNPSVTIEGSIDANAKLIINGTEVIPDDSGKFKKIINLTGGVNTIKVSAKKLLGKEAVITKEIIYQPPPPDNDKNNNNLNNNYENAAE